MLSLLRRLLSTRMLFSVGLRHEYAQKFLSKQNIYYSLLGCVTLNDLHWVEHKMATHVGLPLWCKLFVTWLLRGKQFIFGRLQHILVFEFLLFLKAVLWYTDVTFKFRTFASLLQRKVKIQRLGSGQFRVFLVVMWRHHFPKQKHINLCEVLVLSDVRPSKKIWPFATFEPERVPHYVLYIIP